jgi:DNA polymerase elongation subunit (family B)
MQSLNDFGDDHTGITINYNGEDDINIPVREDLYKSDKITKNLEKHIESNQLLFFMPIDINEVNIKKYSLKIFGILMNGAKTEVNITGIDIFFDVGIPKGVSESIITNDINIMLHDLSIPYWITDIYAYSLHGFSEEKQLFKRIFTTTSYHRTKLLNVVKQMQLETFSNDSSHYFRKAARENKLSLSDWVSLENYEYKSGNNLCEHIFTLDKSNYKSVTDNSIRSLPLIIKDRSLIMCWDIETYSSRKTGEVPKAENKLDIVFMICLTIHWINEADALYKICLVDKETTPDPRWTTIVCKNETNILKAMAICWNHFKPDIFSGYNDSGYDWPFVVERSTQLNILPWMWSKMSAIYYSNQSEDNIIKYNYNNRIKREIKINAEKCFYSNSLNVPGTVCIDVLPCFMKIYPRDESSKYGSLKFYLKDNNLPSKIDLSPIMLWKYYEKGDPMQMKEIAYYCIIDTISVQRLLVKRSIISDYREIATLAYVCLSDSHYYAGGVKVCNLVAAHAYPDILVNMKPKYHTKTDKYPGAYVFPPDKGMTPNVERLNELKETKDIDGFYKDRPVSCLDFASLYPSLIMTYNLSPEKIILTQTDKNKWEQKYKLHEINFDMGEKNIKAWSILHSNDTDKMGLFPTILLYLFNKRKEMKALLKTYTDKKEIYELIFNQNIEIVKSNIISDISELNEDITFIPLGSTIEDEISTRKRRRYVLENQLLIVNSINVKTIEEDYSDICFKINCIDKKQNALKIYMNTFYGETGNHLSPFFLLQLAGGVTSAGQYNIKMVAEFVKNKQFYIKYGDSVMPYTPITIKNNNTVIVTSIDSLSGLWIPYDEFKSDESNRYDKQQLLLSNTCIWTDIGYSRIKRVIRHSTTKKIYRIITNSGIIDVTEDHSLLDNNNNIIKPSECEIGMKLLHSKPSITISEIINGGMDSDIKYRGECDNNGYFIINMKDQCSAQLNCVIMQSLGYNISIKEKSDNSGNCIISYTKNINLDNSNNIKEIYVLHEEYTGFVYDIETERGNFHAGIGNLILKNTDSLYLTCPNYYFKDYDLKYINDKCSKEEYFTAMVKTTLRVVAQLEQEINEFLEQNNGTKFLKMENEGCNYPCIFLGKKKYFGIKHLNEANFKPKKLHIKGIEVVKQGQAGISKEIGNTIMFRAVSITNEKSLLEIVKEILYDSINSNNWKFEDFIQSGTWKPTKDNQSVQRFMKRMAVRHTVELKENEILKQNGKDMKILKYQPLEPGERFSYVLVKNNIMFDLQGRKVTVKIGDMMEYAHIAKEDNIEIDIVHYLIHYVIGICARFISSEKQFTPDSSITDEKKIDEQSIKLSKKFLEDYVKELSGICKKDIIEKGKECKYLFKTALQLSVQNISNQNVKSILQGPIIKISESEDSEVIDILLDLATKTATQLYKKKSNDFNKNLCTMFNINYKTGSDLTDPSKSINLYNHLKIKRYILNDYTLRKEINSILSELITISLLYRTNLTYIIDCIKNKTDINVNFDYLELESIGFVNLWYKIIGYKLYYINMESFVSYINDLKFKRTRSIKPPTKIEIDQLIKDVKL